MAMSQADRDEVVTVYQMLASASPTFSNDAMLIAAILWVQLDRQTVATRRPGRSWDPDDD